MLNAIAGVWNVDSGSILIDNMDITNLAEHKRAKYIGRVFQDPMTGTAATMNIEENLSIALKNLSKQEKKNLCNEYIEKFHLTGLNKRYPWQLSGGQQQRVAIARAVIKKRLRAFSNSLKRMIIPRYRKCHSAAST